MKKALVPLLFLIVAGVAFAAGVTFRNSYRDRAAICRNLSRMYADTDYASGYFAGAAWAFDVAATEQGEPQ